MLENRADVKSCRGFSIGLRTYWCCTINFTRKLFLRALLTSGFEHMLRNEKFLIKEFTHF